MDALEAIKQRLSANKYDTARPLSEAEIRELIWYATQAPSAYNIQHARFVAVTKEEDKQRLRAVAYNQQKVVDAAVTFIVLGDLKGYEKLPDLMDRAVKAGVIKPEMKDGWVKMATDSYAGNERFERDEAIRSAALAGMTLMIAAQSKGLMSGPMIGFDPEGVKREFNLADRYVPVMLITVGYPAPGNFPRKPRFEVDEVLAFGSGEKL